MNWIRDSYKKFLEKRGYIHESEITETWLSQKLSEVIGDPMESSIEPKQEEEFFRDLSKIEGASEYFRATAAKDMQRYFAAPDDKQRETVRGAFARTVYLRSRLSKTKDSERDEKAKMSGLRYGE